MVLMMKQTLAKDSTTKIRIIIGTFVTSLLVPISLYFSWSFFTSVLGKFLYSVTIIICAFRFITIYHMLKLLALFYFTTFSIGGGLIAAHFVFQNPIGLSDNGLDRKSVV